MTPPEPATAFERIGGLSTVLTVVEGLYERALADPRLAPFFHDTNIPAQRDRLAGMVSHALGGPRSAWTSGLVRAHHGRGITDGHFERMTEHLVDALDEVGAEEGDVEVVRRWLATVRWSVVDT